MSEIIFYVFAALTSLSALAVISARNPVHSVLFLIFTFLNAACIFVLLGAEFLAMILVIVYVGAVSVLFLFVVMMLDINFKQLRSGFMRYLPVGLGLAVIFLAELVLIIYSGAFEIKPVAQNAFEEENTRLIGNHLYTDHILLFQISGIILLVAMIGSIVLTLRHRTDTKRQNIQTQNTRKISDDITLVSLKPGETLVSDINKKD
ncbi:MAG: NADH-quinone oxidoreductase subunit J [Pseudomonadota bacterium]